MTATIRDERPSSLEERMSQLEQLLQAQAERMAAQEAEISAQREELARLRTPTTPPFAMPLPISPDSPVEPALEVTSDERPAGKRARSRRALLKLGGAAAAAGVAAAAAAATELAQPGTAEAAGVPWATGTVLADEQTVVTPRNTYISPTMLTLTAGFGTPTFPVPGGPSMFAALAAQQTAGGRSVGVWATSNASFAVIGLSGGPAAFQGDAPNGYGAILTGGVAPVLLTPGMGSGAPGTGIHNAGELYVDGAGMLWLCNSGATMAAPATWVRLPGVANGVPGGALNYLSAPIRIFDSRAGQPAPLPLSKAPLAGGSTTTIQVTGTTVGGLSVPAGATGAFGNLTVTNAQNFGDLILFPHGAPQPLTSNINYGPGQTIANSFSVGLDPTGAMDLFVHVSGTDVIIDIAGYVL